MKTNKNQRLRLALRVVVAAALVLMTAGTLFAAGEQLPRSAILSGGSTHSSNGYTIRDQIGLWASGSSIAPNGLGLCSGFGCTARVNVTPDGPDDTPQLFIPRVQTQGVK